MKLSHLFQWSNYALKSQWPRRFHLASQLGTKNEKMRRDLEKKEKKRIHRQELKKRIPVLAVPGDVTINELAKLTKKTVGDVKYAMRLAKEEGLAKGATFKALLPKIVNKLGYKIQLVPKAKITSRPDKDIYAEAVTTDINRLKPRPPIVAVMGHVDHGKTTLLDALRKTSVAASEAGGITQSIGAFSVPLSTGQTITFIDTPGHSVFTSMRERGAKVTDIVVLVVAADDGVMEQTIESINMAKMAEASVVVALNKCDKKGVQPDLAIDELDNYGIKCEKLGGDVQAIKISALKNQGLDNLVHCIATQSELLDLRSDPGMQVQGAVLETRMEKGRGPMASVVVHQGTVNKGTTLLAGTSFAKVRQLFDSNGEKVDSAGPGMAVDVMGWRSLPHAGQMILGVESELRAKQAIAHRTAELKHLHSAEILEEVEEQRKIERKEYQLLKQEHSSSKERTTQSFILAIAKNTQESSIPELNIIVKADVDGSMEALMKVLNSYDCNDKCELKLLHHGIGDLGERDIELAEKFDATVFLFNTDIGPSARTINTDNLAICKHKVIYHFVDELRSRIEDRLLPVEDVEVHGEAEVLQVFQTKLKKISKDVAGCRVLKGVMTSRRLHRVIRSEEVIHSGELSSMRQVKQTVKEVAKGAECGLLFADDVNLQVGDRIECISPYMKKAKLEWRPPGF